jgi:hypothetical protein
MSLFFSIRSQQKAAKGVRFSARLFGCFAALFSGSVFVRQAR